MRATLTWIVVLACMGPAAAVAAQQPPIAKGKPADPDKKICKRSVPSGSLIPGNAVCRTRSEWAGLAAAGNQEARDMADRARTSAPPQ